MTEGEEQRQMEIQGESQKKKKKVSHLFCKKTDGEREAEIERERRVL